MQRCLPIGLGLHSQSSSPRRVSYTQSAGPSAWRSGCLTEERAHLRSEKTCRKARPLSPPSPGGTHILRQTAIAILCAIGAPALAQTDTIAMGRIAAANQLGVLEYCQANGDVGPDAVSAEKDVISHMPASAVSTESAEAIGKQGTLAAPNGQQMTLASIATKQDSTVPAMCKQLGSSAVQASAMYKQNGMSAGGIPSMQSMPQMPAMPGGMPTMGTMPSGAPAVPPR
jgi:hypothetical protein